MYFFDGVIVVEGKGDVSYLSSFIDCEYLTTNGYDVSDDLLDYINHISNRKVIVMTDPDEAGRNIEKVLRVRAPNCVFITPKIECCDRKNKHGVAECEKDEILRILKPYLIDSNDNKNSFSRQDYVETGLYFDANKRDVVCKELHLGKCNSKTLFKRLNFNHLTKKDIINLWK